MERKINVIWELLVEYEVHSTMEEASVEGPGKIETGAAV